MRVAIDTSPLKRGDKVRGVGEYTRQLFAALGKKAKTSKNLHISEVDLSKDDLSGHDLLHLPYFSPFQTTLPKNSNTKVIVTIHDLTPLIYPKHYPPGFRGWLNLQAQKRRLKEVDAIITDSETSKKDIVRFFGIKTEKIFPTHLAAADHFRVVNSKDKLEKVARKYRLPKKFVLYVGDINYNKNIPGLIKACSLAKLPLVIVGKQAKEIEELGVDLHSISGPRDWIRFLFNQPHPELAHYKKILSAYKSNNQVMRLGFVPIEELVAIYNLATVYCQPSFYEGFGLPVLEAMACGTPVVAARTQALVEIAGNSALFADPKDPKDLADKIKSVFNDKKLQEELLKKGLKLSKKYSWKKTASETIRVYKAALDDGGD